MPREWLTLEQYKEYMRRKQAMQQVPPEQGLLENAGSITGRVSGKVVSKPKQGKPPTQVIGVRG